MGLALRIVALVPTIPQQTLLDGPSSGIHSEQTSKPKVTLKTGCSYLAST